MPPTGGLRTSLSFSVQGGPLSNARGVFSPGTALAPIAQEPARGWDFPLGVNSVLAPRAYEPFGFPQLRAFANVELVRLAIETRKDQVEGLGWRIKPRDRCIAGDDADPRIAALEAFWRKPDGATPFATGTLSTFGASCNASGSGTSASNFVPIDWTLTGSAALNTALTGTPTPLATCGYGTDPNGKPAFFIYGQMAASGGITLSQALTSSSIFINATGTPDLVRGHLKIVLDKGPGGHLYGLASPIVKQSNQVSAAGSVYGVPCPTTNCTLLNGQAADNAGLLVSYTDNDAPRTLDLWSNPAIANNDAGGTLSSASLSAILSLIASNPIDMKVWLESAEQEITGK